MLRREFIAGAAAFSSLAWPLSAKAQQATAHRTRVGILIYSTPERDPNIQALLEGLRQLGYVDGQNIAMTWRSARHREKQPTGPADVGKGGRGEPALGATYPRGVPISR